MKTFMIDSTVQTFLFSECPDYTTRMVLAATADPLFIYDKKKKDVIAHAALRYEYSESGRMLKIELRRDLFFYNGKRVIAKDYKNAVLQLLETKLQIRKYFEKVKVDILNDWVLQIKLPFKNMFFHKYLSSITLSPQENSITSGPYYIKKQENGQVILARNRYYRTNIKRHAYEEISFCQSLSGERDIKSVLNNNIYCTCSTNLTYEQRRSYENNIREYDSFIYVDLVWTNLNLLQPQYYELRKRIFESIDKERFPLKDIVNMKTSFVCCNIENDINNRIVERRNNPKFKMKNGFEELLLAYDDFYPNKIIAVFIKFQIETTSKIKIRLIEDNYYNPSGKYDMKLMLNVPDYLDKTAYLLSPKFYSYVKLDFVKCARYRYYMKKAFKAEKMVDVEKNLAILNRIILNRYLRLRLFSLKHAYISCSSELNLDFDELNYDNFY